jgi:hypothetical protein
MAGTLPFEFVDSVVLAWPFASEPSFHIGASMLAERDAGVVDASTAALSRSLIEYLRPRVRGCSVEILRQMQESVWFDQDRRPTGPTSVPLVNLLGRVAGELLQFEGGRVVLRHAGIQAHQVTSRWRWISLVLSPDVLIAAHAATVTQEAPADHVTIMPPHLWPLLEETRLADTHLHFGAAVPFEVLWSNLVTCIGAEPDNGDRLDRSGPAPLGGGETFLSWLTIASLARLVLAGYLWQWDRRLAGDREDLATVVGRIAARTRDPALVSRALSALRRGHGPPDYRQLRPVLGNMLPTRRPDLRVHPRDLVASVDPLSRWVGGGRTMPETRFLVRALRRLREEPRDAYFGSLLWQYLRVRGLVYRHLVQEPGTAGLDWFTTYYNRISPLRGRLSDALMGTTLELESRTGRLDSLEVRTSPPSGWMDVRELVQHVAWSPARSSVRPERGLVLHFLKQQRVSDSATDHADPRQGAHGCRYGSYYWNRRIEALALEAALRYHPQLLAILRGIDVCSVELAEPTWVFLPLLARLRAASQQASAALGSYARIPPLRVTLHAGEDFRRLCEGLRRIHEPIEFGALQNGDRLGHAVALGVPPVKWAESSDSTPQPAIERLDDLLWEVARYRSGDMLAEAARVERVRGEIEHLARSIYDRGCTLEDLLEARRLRHDPRKISELGYPFMRGIRLYPKGAAMQLLWDYLTSADVYVRGQRPVRVRNEDSEIHMLQEAQRFLRRTLAAIPVVVEANPSSNVLVGDLRLEDHPAFQLYPLPGQLALDGVRVPVSLGDDDPMVFATTLADEVGHLYFALLARKVPSLDAQEWLSGLAANGMTSRFTLRESILGDHVPRRKPPTWVRGARRIARP